MSYPSLSPCSDTGQAGKAHGIKTSRELQETGMRLPINFNAKGEGKAQERHPWVIPGECAKRTPKELSTQTVGGDSEQSHPEKERIQRTGMFSPITS